MEKEREHLSRLQQVLKAHSQPDATIYSEGKKVSERKNMIKGRSSGEIEEVWGENEQ